MTVRLIEGQVPYTGGTAIEITADKVINLLLRAENNLLHVNDDNELYCDLQLENGIAVDDDLPVGVTTGIVNESDGRPQNGLLLHYETTSGAYAQWLYGGDGKLYFNGGTGERKLVYYAEDVDQLLQELHDELVEQLTMNAGEGIEILNGPDYSAMRGPCPEGFHIFQYAEQVSLQEMMVTLGIDSNPIDYLKTPLTGYRNSWSSGEVNQGGASTVIWSVDSAGGSLQSIHTMYIQSDKIRTNNVSNRGAGNVIRPIKDIPVIPNNTWTTLFDGSSIATGAGVYHSPDLGLISISDDGENRITIADKNLGATVVYENGDALSDANCGNLYQWGNNYGFTHDGTVTTSYNKVDTTGYGPGNYYYGTTFILTHLSTDDKGDWSEEINDNLWGGVTGVQDLHNVITNRGVLSVNGRKGHVIVADNVKLFEVNYDTNIAQEAYEWILSGKEAIIRFRNESYFLSELDNNHVRFEAVNKTCETNSGGHAPFSNCGYKTVDFELTNGQVTQVTSSWRHNFNLIDPTVEYVEPFNPTHPSNPTSKKYVDDNIGLRVFQFADWSDLTTGQAAYDWYKSGKLPVLLYNNILYYPFQKSGGWLMFYPLELDHHTAASGHGQYSYYNRIRITINTTNDIVTAINASTRTPYGYRIDPNEDYQDPYMAQYDGSPVTRKYLDGRIISDSTAPASPTEGALWYDTTNDILKSYDGTNWNTVGDDTNNINTKTFYITGSTSSSIAKAALKDANDRRLSGKNALLSRSGITYTYLGEFNGKPTWASAFNRVTGGTGDSVISRKTLRITVDGSGNVTAFDEDDSTTSPSFGILRTDITFMTPFTPTDPSHPATKIYVDQSGPCVPVYHLGGGNVMTSYINFDMAGGTYKVKIQGYHGTTINRTLTVTASSALAGTFTSNLIEHYNYECIVTIDPSVSTTMIIQIDSNSNFTVDDIYIEKINIQSGIVTATSIN